MIRIARTTISQGLAALALLVTLPSCGGDDPPPQEIVEQPDCDGLVPEYCAMPWPSDRFLVEDASTPTGYRLAFGPDSLPRNSAQTPLDLDLYHRLDGFSPASHFLIMFPDVPDLETLAHHDSIERSLEPDAAIVLIDLDTRERVPYWVEPDLGAEFPSQTVVFIRPARRLDENRSYGVAVRGIGPSGGPAFPASPTFLALRDGAASGYADNDEITRRRPSYDDLFAALSDAGVDIGGLQLAWWFHTASGDASRADLLAMRADALERIGSEGIGCTITSVDDGYNGLYRRVQGTITTPSYMETSEPGARMVRGSDTMPVYVEDIEVPFTAIIPAVLANDPAGPRPGPMIMWGHGLFGDAAGSVSSSGMQSLAEGLQAVVGGVDWAGMASEDVGTVATALVNISHFAKVAERLEQGMINQITAHRTLAGVCRTQDAFLAPDGTSLIDPSQKYFIGGSQGGIYGGTLLTLSPDVERGVLVVGGSNYPLMIQRSTNWPDFEAVFAGGYRARIDRIFLLNFIQQIWDYTDPASYLPYTLDGLADIGPKKMLYITAHNDAQVPNVASDIAARTAGLPVIEGSTRVPYGLELRTQAYDGSGFITIDMGDPEVPFGNTPPPSDEGGHGSVGFSATSTLLVQSFLRPDGQVVMPGCTGVCDPD